MKSAIILLNLLAFITCTWCMDQAREKFHPFGSGAGDRRLTNSADPAATIRTRDSYIFFGEEYSNVFLSDNGYVTLKNPLRTNRPTSFPIKSGSFVSRRSRMIAPYWSDIDTRCGGDIWYRQVRPQGVSSRADFDKVQEDVRSAGYTFEPTSAVIVTWAGVTSQNKAPCQDQRRNTFQFVLTTNGIQTFAIFRYKTLEWHTSSVGRGPATAGVNAGDFLNGFSLRDPKDILNLVSMSNVGVRGLFVYRLDLGPNSRISNILMGEMMEVAAANAMEFGVAESELYIMHDDNSSVQFTRQSQDHIEEYVGGLTAKTQRVSFYPFDSSDDSTLGSSDEATSGRELLKRPICFFGKNYSSLVVYTNGFLTLGDFYNFPTYIPRVLKTTRIPIVAPYFADADTRGRRSGRVYFRQTDDATLTLRAKQDIEFVFPGVSFSPQQLYIVTWENAGFYNHHDNLVNSYQAIIATDSHTSYVIFIYDRVEWTSPDSTGIVAGSGVGTKPSRLPVLGISDGSSVEHLVGGSEEPRNEKRILKVAQNVGTTVIPGLWIFEASTSTQSRAKVQRSGTVDPKMQYLADHRPSRPYVSAEMQALSDVESLVSELDYAKNID